MISVKNIFIALTVFTVSGCAINTQYPTRLTEHKTETQFVDEQRLIAMKAEKTISLRQFPAFDPHVVEHQNAIWDSKKENGDVVFPDRKLTFYSEEDYLVCLKDAKYTCLTYGKNEDMNIRLNTVRFRMDGHPNIELTYSYPSGVLEGFYVFPDPAKTECGYGYSFKPNGEPLPVCCS